MEIVLDTNVIISSLLRNGLTRKIIFLSPLQMYTVDYAKIEIEAYKEELLRKSKLDERSLNYLSEFVFSKKGIARLIENFIARIFYLNTDFSNQDDVVHILQLFAAAKGEHERTMLQRQVEAIDRQIEIKIAEEA